MIHKMKKKQMKILCAGSQPGTSMLLKLWYTAINGVFGSQAALSVD
jgi:hypothetical protein